MANPTPNRDLSDLLTSIECLRQELRDTGSDPTARMVQWSRTVLRRTNPGLKFSRSFEQMPAEKRWQRVRAYLSPQLLKAMQGNLNELKHSRHQQLNLFEKDDE